MTASACPACAAGDLAIEQGRPEVLHEARVFSLPSIHCAGCIRGVENTLAALPEVSTARVNFSLKRVTVHADPAMSDTALIARLTSAGFEAHPLSQEALEASEDAHGRSLLWRMGLAGFAMMNVMLLSVAVWSGAEEATRAMFHWISAMIALPSALIAAQPFFESAARALKGRRLNMDVPIALAILLALTMSLYETMQGGRHAYFDAALSLTFFLLAGRYLDHRTRRAARSAAKELTAMEPARVQIAEGAGLREVALADLRAGDVVCLKPGQRLAVDGVLEEGTSLLDLSFISGEADPVPSRPEEMLAAGTIALTGPLRVRATGVGEDSTLRRLAALVEVAENARGRYRSLSDKAAALYAPGVHLLALAALVGWLWATGDLRLALNIAVAVLIITCPCALGLAVPAVATSVTGRLFRKGVILTSATALERLAEVDEVVFDKTGTLTATRFDRAAAGLTQDQEAVLKALAQGSDHPLSRAIAAALEEGAAADLCDVREHAGFGVTAHWQGRPVRLGAGEDGQTVFDDGAVYVLRFVETPLPGARAMIADLTARGLRPVLLSGDGPERVRELATALGFEEALAQVSPEEKADYVTARAEAGARVLMVGDGLNDTAALARAHASIAPGTALEASRNAADAILIGGEIAQIPEVLEAAGTARCRIRQNFALAGIYNIIAVPVALAGLATPLIAAIAMSASSITVVLNALRGERL